MGAREQEMPEPPQIYMLPAPLGICHTKWENKKHRVDRERMGSRSGFKHCEKVSGRKGKQETEEPESAATSAGSYLDQPFFTLGGAGRTRPYICPPHVGVRWVGYFFFVSCCAPYFFLLPSGRNGHTVPKKSNRFFFCLFFWCILTQIFTSN